jgi:hypothetical protein
LTSRADRGAGGVEPTHVDVERSVRNRLYGERPDVTAVRVACTAVPAGSVFWVLLGEVFPTQNRAGGVSAGSTTNWTASFAVALGFLPLLSAIGTGQTFWLFAVVCALGIWFVGRYVPETKDREFPKVDAELQARAKGDVRPPAGLPGRTT